jgi:hypothetical protein
MTDSFNHRPGEKEEREADGLPEDEGNMSLIQEFVIFLREDRKWWLLPMMVTIALLGFLLFVGTCTPLSPFIYSLF